MSWAPFPDEKYQIIYADPPWKYGGSGGTKWRRADEYYETMTFDELERLPVSKITDKKCLLFMWVVSPKLKECIKVGESWGFKYVTVAFVWYKERANCGNYTMSGCELCLVFKKYQIPEDRIRNPGTKQFYAEPISGHSRKPEEFRKRIKHLFPKSKKIELFSTEKHEGWVAWGDESKFGNPFQTMAEIKKLARKS